MTIVLTAVTMLLFVQAGARVPQAPAPAPTTKPAQAATVTGGKAFRSLFTVELNERSRAELADGLIAMAQPVGGAPAPERRVVCGMVVIQADPSVDPKIVKQIPGDPASMKIRRIPAATCTD